MNSYLLLSVTPKPGRMLDALAAAKEVRKVLEPHAEVVTQFRASIAGPMTGQLFTSMSWSSAAAMGKRTDELHADRAYLDFATRRMTGDTAVSSQTTTMGTDVPGFEGSAPGLNVSGKARTMGVISYPYNDEVLAFLPDSKAMAERRGYGWFCRLWSIGTPSGESAVSVYNVHSSRVAWGESLDSGRIDPGSIDMLRRVRPYVRRRMILEELLG